jgi:hypothetical protein
MRTTILAGALGLAMVVSPAAFATTAAPGITVLIRQATQRVRAQHPTARLLAAEGSTRRGRPTTSATGVVAWKFVYGISASNSPIASATITYGPAPKRFGAVLGSTQPIVEDTVIRTAPKMSLRQAVDDLRRTKYRDAFTAVTLRSPLGPRQSPPLYIFTTTHHGFVAVNTKTARVSVLH